MVDNELTFDMIGNGSEESTNTNDSETTKQNTSQTIEEEEPLFQEKEETTESSPDKEKEEELSEGVDGKSQEVKENAEPDSDGKSPNFYASIAKSLKEDGILTLDENDFNNIETADDVALLFQKQLETMLDGQQKRITDALNNGIQPDVIKEYEGVISYLNGIDEDTIKAETQEAEDLRGNIIYQDYINRGFSQERAEKEVKKAFDAGTDVDDAIDSLKELKQFYTTQYNGTLESAKQERQTRIIREKELSAQIEKKFLETEDPIKDIKLSELERKKILGQYTKFVDKDELGNPLNAIQKYAKENPVDYQYNINLLYYLTNGFKDLGTVIQQQVKKNTRSALSNLESTLRNPNNHLGGGSINYDNDRSPESYKGISVQLD